MKFCVPPVGFWTPERQEQLKAFCATKQYSMTEIAKMMGTTRNAVAGRIHRTGLVCRSHVVAQQDQRRIRPVPLDNPTEKWFRERIPTVSEPKPWLEREFGECAFPVETDGNTQSCCKPVSWRTVHGKVVVRNYCEDHCAIMYENWKPARPRPPQLKTNGRFA